MKTSKIWSIMMMLVVVLGTVIAFSSCSKDDDDDDNGGSIPSGLIGSWYSTNFGSTGRSGTVIFKSNKTVEIEYESRSSCKNFQGTFTVSGNTIKCKGVSATVYYSDGEENVEPNSSTTFTYSNAKLTGGFYSDCNQFSKY